MAFSTFVSKNNKKTDSKIRLREKITNMYHDLDHSIKKMKHDDIAKHLRDKFLETEPTFNSGTVMSRSALLAFIVFVLGMITLGNAQLANAQSGGSTAIVVPGETKTDENKTALVLENYPFENEQNDEDNYTKLVQIGQIGKQGLVNIENNIIINKTRRMKRLNAQMLQQSGYPVLVENILKFFKKDFFKTIIDVEQWTENILMEYTIPEIEKHWVRQANKVPTRISVAKQEEGGEQAKYVSDKLRAINIKNALLFDFDFYELVLGDNDNREELAIKQGKKFCMEKIDYFNLDGLTENSIPDNELDKIIRDLVKLLENPNEKVIWQQNFALVAKAVPAQLSFINILNKEIDLLTHDIDGAPNEKKIEIRTEILMKVEAILLNHLRLKIQNEPAWLTAATDDSTKLEMIGQGWSTRAESRIRKEATRLLEKMKADNLSEKKFAILSLLEKSRKSVKFLTDVLNWFSIGLGKVVEDQTTDKENENARNFFANNNGSNYYILFNLLMALPLSTAILLIPVAAAGGGLVAYKLTPNCGISCSCCGSASWEFLKTFTRCCGYPVSFLYDTLTYLRVQTPIPYQTDYRGRRIVTNAPIFSIGDENAYFWWRANNSSYRRVLASVGRVRSVELKETEDHIYRDADIEADGAEVLQVGVADETGGFTPVHLIVAGDFN